MGEFIQTGYTLRHIGITHGWPRWHHRAKYEFTLDAVNPLTYKAQEHLFIQPDRHGTTDMGSIPEALQVIIPKDRFLKSFIIHDSACRERGLYFSGCPARAFNFAPMSSRRIHDLLREMVLAEGGASWQARLIWCAVRSFGPHFSTQPRG